MELIALLVDSYRSKDWKKFRDEVIRLDGNACSKCERTSADGAVLQVHHKHYLPGRKPWQYAYDACYTLCSGCHAAEHGIIPPKFGWEHAGWEDLGDLIGKCDCCGTAIRYSFMVSHADWHPMEVGEVCCDHLTSSQVASSHMESKRRYSSRLKRFVSSSRWSAYSNGKNLITHKGFSITITPAPDGYRTSVNGTMGKARHENLLGAKAAIFEVIESGKMRAYFSKHPGWHI